MGVYTYRITAKTIDTPVGKANLIKYAYKPYYGMGDLAMANNAKLHFKSGCTAAEGMVKRGTHTGLAADVDQYGNLTTVYKTGDMGSFDDYWMDARIIWQQGDAGTANINVVEVIEAHGIGGGLLQKLDRDTCKYAVKTTAEIANISRVSSPVYKDGKLLSYSSLKSIRERRGTKILEDTA